MEPYPVSVEQPNGRESLPAVPTFLFSEWGHTHCISSLHYQLLSIKETIILLLTPYQHGRMPVLLIAWPKKLSI